MKPTFEEFQETVRTMRDWQRRYFKAEAYSPEKREALGESKHYEKQVDKMLAELAEPQESLL